MKRILVVDDEQEILSLLRRFFDKLGYDSAVTDSWEIALERFYDESFDLVILDVHMPGRDGFQIAKEMKVSKPDQKILIITGLDPGEAFKYLSEVDVEVCDVLYKPFSFGKMKKFITQIIGGPC